MEPFTDPQLAIAGDRCEFLDDSQVHKPGEPGMCVGTVSGLAVQQPDGEWYLPVATERPALRGGVESTVVWVHPENLLAIIRDE